MMSLGSVSRATIVLGVVAAVLPFVLHHYDKSPAREHVGRAVACSDRFPFKNRQAEVLEYGLEDVRGLAADGNRVFIAEKDRSLLVDWPDYEPEKNESRLQSTQEESLCSEQPCSGDDPQGLAIMDGKLYSAEHDQAQVVSRNVPTRRFKPDKDGKPIEAVTWWNSATVLQDSPEHLIQPSGIAAGSGRLFITGEPVETRPSSDPVEQGESDKGKLVAMGSLYRYDPASKHMEPILGSLSLSHPSGVAIENFDGNEEIVVAERDLGEVRWPVYRISDGKWTQTQSLGSIPLGRETTPSFFGVAIDSQRKMVFAAGPGGLYVFDLDKNGGPLGRVVFDSPVTGVAVAGDRVYLAVGQTLCVLYLEPFKKSVPTGALRPPADSSRSDEPSPGAQEKTKQRDPHKRHSADSGSNRAQRRTAKSSQTVVPRRNNIEQNCTCQHAAPLV